MLPPFLYSPFTRPIDTVDASDLPSLRSAAEGWHLDYKREVPDTDSAAKSISSFANSYGGWVVYGVEAPGGGSWEAVVAAMFNKTATRTRTRRWRQA